MTTRNRPNYGIYYLPLTVAGAMDVPAIGTRVAMIGAYTGAVVTFAPGGAQELSGGTPAAAIVGVQIGKALGDLLPFTVGNKVRVDNKFDFVRFTWAAQSGVTAIIAISDDAEGNGVEFDAAPIVTLGNLSIVQGGNTVSVEGAGSEGVLVARTQSRVGDSFVNQTGVGTAAIQIVAPGTNVNGVIVRANSVIFAATSQSGVLATGTVAPTTTSSNENICYSIQGQLQLGNDIFVPPGSGLWLLSSAAASMNASISYKVL